MKLRLKYTTNRSYHLKETRNFLKTLAIEVRERVNWIHNRLEHVKRRKGWWFRPTMKKAL